MNNDQKHMIIRKATRADARQIAEIIVEDWKNAYRAFKSTWSLGNTLLWWFSCRHFVDN